ncbi:hypothetical protein ACLKA6_000126 [Drosophila palustris]
MVKFFRLPFFLCSPNLIRALKAVSGKWQTPASSSQPRGTAKNIRRKSQQHGNMAADDGGDCGNDCGGDCGGGGGDCDNGGAVDASCW